jgi:hypothetical protein
LMINRDAVFLFGYACVFFSEDLVIYVLLFLAAVEVNYS